MQNLDAELYHFLNWRKVADIKLLQTYQLFSQATDCR